jgi:ribosomal-protein-alanine N-acetyltransferase
MIPAGESARLLLRPLAVADAAQIQALFPRWEIVRYLERRVPWPYPDDGARQFIERIELPVIKRGEAWSWTLRLKTAPDAVIGNLELRKGDGDNRGFWLCPEWRRRGLMVEACYWANDFWFERLGFSLLRVSKAVENTASRRISERMGMRLVGRNEKEYVCGRLLSEIWEMTADEWRAWKSARKAVGNAL